MNNKVETLKRHLASLLEAHPEINNDIDKIQLLPEYKMMIDAMEEYGKYCAEQALLYFNGNEVGHIEVNEWWSEFQGKQERGEK